MEAAALRLHRPAGPSAAGPEKGARRRRLTQRGPRDVVLFADWTFLRLFPPLRAAWALAGVQAVVPITGANAKRVLFGALHPRTGHRIVTRRLRAGGADARAFLRELRRRYTARETIWLLVDRASGHTAAATQALAVALDIRLLWLPTPTPALNAMDQLWRELKRRVAANRQAASIDGLAAEAEAWVLGLTPQEARRKAGVLSARFWLKHLLQDFRPPT